MLPRYNFLDPNNFTTDICGWCGRRLLDIFKNDSYIERTFSVTRFFSSWEQVISKGFHRLVRTTISERDRIALTNCPHGLVFQFIRDPPLRRPTTILLSSVTDRYIKSIEKFLIRAYRRSSIFYRGYNSSYFAKWKKKKNDNEKEKNEKKNK